MYGEDNLPKIIEFTKLNGSPVKIIMPEKKARKIVDYVIVSSREKTILNSHSIKVKFDDEDKEHLIESPEQEVSLSVKHLIRKGFVLYGKLKVCRDSDGYLYICQAMVKYED